MFCTRARPAAHFAKRAVIGAGALLWAVPAYAYLDPATASIILQGILAGFAGLMVVLRMYWTQMKAFFTRLRGGAQLPVEETKVAAPATSDGRKQ